MPLVLRPLRLSEVGAYERVTHAAFEKGLMPLFFPNGKTPGARAHMAHLARETMQSDPYARYMAVVDTELEPEAGDIAQDGDSNDKKTEGQAETKGRIVGVAFWKFYEHERTDEEIEEEKRKAKESGDPPDCSVEMFNSFFGILAKCKKETMGNQPFIRKSPHHPLTEVPTYSALERHQTSQLQIDTIPGSHVQSQYANCRMQYSTSSRQSQRTTGVESVPCISNMDWITQTSLASLHT